MSEKKCGHKVPCGCEDTPLSTAPPCETGTLDCPTPDPCPETFSDECLIHTGDTIMDTGILNGERLYVTLQRLSLFMINPGCVTPGSTCLSALGLKSTSVSSTTIALAWLEASTALSYQVEYKLATDVSWTLAVAQTAPATTDTIGGLTPDTDYHIRVNAICAAGNCYSVTILVKTKA